MRLLALAVLFVSTTAHAALEPGCEAAVRAHADVLIAESEMFRKAMQTEVTQAERSRDGVALFLFAILVSPSTNAVRFENGVRDLVQGKKLSSRYERAITSVCDNDLRASAEAFNY